MVDTERAKMAKKFGGKSIKDYTPKQLVERAEGNHIWLNAFSCIKPTDKFLIGVGRSILSKLEETDLRDSFGVSKMIILTINKS